MMSKGRVVYCGTWEGGPAFLESLGHRRAAGAKLQGDGYGEPANAWGLLPAWSLSWGRHGRKRTGDDVATSLLHVRARSGAQLAISCMQAHRHPLDAE